MTLTVAAGAQVIANHFRSTVTVYDTVGYDSNGQPSFGTGRTVSCVIVPKESRSIGDTGDLIVNSGYSILIPATDPLTVRGYVELPDSTDGPVLGQVSTHLDQWGNILYKEVIIA